MKRLIILIMSLGGISLMNAQMLFSLEEAVDYALENNKQLRANRYDIQKSESAYKETRAGWLPQVDATVDYMTYFGYEMEFNMMGSGFDKPTKEQQDIAYAATVKEFSKLPTATIDQSLAAYNIGQTYSNALQATYPPTTIDMGGTSTAKVQVGQVLFNGQLLSGLSAAKIGMEMAKKSVEISELDLRANVTNAYYSVLTLEKTLTTIDSSLSEMQDLVKKTEVMVRAGVMEETELDQLRVQLNNLKNTKLTMNRNVQITYNLLRFQLGLGINEPITLTDDLDLIMNLMNEENALTQSFGIENNLNYQLLEEQVKMAEEMINMEKMAYAPTLTAFYAYNVKLLTSGFDMNPNNMAGLTLNIPILSGGQRKNKVKQQQIEASQAHANKEIMEDNLHLQEAQLRFDYISKYEEYQNQKENINVARRVYESYERKFEQGVASGMDLTQANSNYLQAESSYLSSILSLLQARVAFFKLLNTL